MPRIPGLLERIQQPLYDRGTVVSTTTQLNFFQVPLGGGATAKTELDTNMDQGGSLPYPKNFELHAIRMVTQYGSRINNVASISQGAWFRLFIGTKNYLVVNAFMLTAGVGLNGVATGVAVNQESVQNGTGDQRGIYVLAEPIDLIPQQNFRCELNRPAAWSPALASVPAAVDPSVTVSIYLDGFFKREVH